VAELVYAHDLPQTTWGLGYSAPYVVLSKIKKCIMFM